jgi:hypothetical protein
MAKILNAQWSNLFVVTGDTVELLADVDGIKKDTEITFSIYPFPRPSPGSPPVDTLKMLIPKGKTSAKRMWMVKYFREESITQGFPEYSFTASLAGVKTTKSTKQNLLTGTTVKPMWVPKSGGPQPGPASIYAAFINGTDPIDMVVEGEGFSGFVFDFFIFSAADTSSAAVFQKVDSITGVKPESSKLVRAEWSLSRLTNPTGFTGNLFKFTYTFRREDGTGGNFPVPDMLPTNANFFADQAKSLPKINLTLESPPATDTLAGEKLVLQFRVTGAGPNSPVEFKAIAKILSNNVDVDVPVITEPDKLVTVIIDTPAAVEADQSGELEILLFDPVRSTIPPYADQTFPLSYLGVRVMLSYPDERKRVEIE